MKIELKKLINVLECLQVRLDDKIRGFEMLWVNPGTFKMGVSSEEKLPSSEMENAFNAIISDGYWLSKFMITNAHWGHIMQQEITKPNIPKSGLSWEDANLFCEELNKRAIDILPTNYRFHIPTELQWEYAARSRDIDYMNLPSLSFDEVDKFAWYLENNSNGSNDVGLKHPNSMGFYDIVGNGIEWCYDDFCEYPNTISRDWVGKCDNIIELKTLRSSSHLASLIDSSHRVTFRGYCDPKENKFSLRVCLSKILNMSKKKAISPFVKQAEWGKITMDDATNLKDVKCYPSGYREWDWRETETKHVPGIQISDVAELLDNGADFIVLSKGYHDKLLTKKETLNYLYKRLGKDNVVCLNTKDAVVKYNELASQGCKVGALLHSTC